HTNRTRSEDIPPLGTSSANASLISKGTRPTSNLRAAHHRVRAPHPMHMLRDRGRRGLQIPTLLHPEGACRTKRRTPRHPERRHALLDGPRVQLWSFQALPGPSNMHRTHKPTTSADHREKPVLTFR